ncbi:MAG: hybrid sensor histidine kinase/response regulator [Deltaproteobacteria bacterium]|nr:hybrid sensor histidine kinase/response regulator [Deltaproteobacteria bacterium]
MVATIVSIVAFVVALVAFARACADHIRDKKLNEELRIKIQQAQQLLQQRGDLANEIAHEIKNPLTAILCSAETLDMLIGQNLHEDHRRSLHYIKEYGDNLLRLVSDFLDVSRAESGHISARPEVTTVLPCVESVIGLLRANAIKKNITVHCLATEPTLDTQFDPRHLKQIVFNLLHNALKFTPENGEIHVIVERDFPNPSIKITVSDSGPGIPPEERERLFRLYARYEGHAASGSAGIGLGLALCKSLVELNNGTIECESTVGVGTAFKIFIPFVARTAEGVRQQSGAFVVSDDRSPMQFKNKPLCGQSFLVVDQDEGARNAIASLINAWGGVVDGVSQATEAVKALQERNYDAVMIDDTLAGNESLDLVRKIRDEQKSKETTIIVAATNPVNPEVAQGMGIDKCVAKPLNGKLLLKSLLNSGKYQITH